MTCRDAIDVLADFLDQTLDAATAAELERHLAGCAPCVAYLNTYRRTRDLTAAAGRPEMPEEMRERLRRFLLDRLGREGQ